MKIIYSCSFICSLLLITSCSTPVVKDPDSYLYSVPVGSILTLNKPITIPANLARLYFQNGNAIAEENLNIYYPHCSLVMNSIVETNRIIQPTTFEIYKVQDDEEFALRYILYASNIISQNDGPTIIGYASYYYLHSSDTPDIRSLECIQWNDPVDVEFVTINEVRKSIGDYFTLELND